MRNDKDNFPLAMIFGVDMNMPFWRFDKEGEVNNFKDGNHKSWFQKAIFGSSSSRMGIIYWKMSTRSLGGLTSLKHHTFSPTQPVKYLKLIMSVSWMHMSVIVLGMSGYAQRLLSAKDHRVHNYYLVILRKRIGLVHPIRMKPGKVVSP